MKKKMQVLPRSTMTIDRSVQRDTETAHVKRIKDNWDETAVGVLHVWKRPDGLFILDGQQRWNAKADEPSYKFHAVVVDEISAKEAADLFVKLNRHRKAVAAADLHRIAVTGEDPHALAIERVVKSMGLVIGKKGRGSTVDTITCVATMERVMNRKMTSVPLKEREAALLWALSVYKGAWGGRASAVQWNAVIIEALAELKVDGFASPAAYLQPNWVAALRRTNPEKYMEGAKALRTATNNRPVGAMRSVLSDRYAVYFDAHTPVAV